MARGKGEPVSDIDAKLKDLEEGLTPAKPDLTVLGIPEIKPEVKAAESEPEVKVEPTSGALILRYKRSLVKRDDEGRIIAIIGDGMTRSIKRDDDGRIVEVIEETEEEIQG